METQTYSVLAQAYIDYRSNVMRYINSIIRNTCEAEDLVEDVFEKALKVGPMLRPETIENLLITIARHRVVDYMRKMSNRTTIKESADIYCEHMAAGNMQSEIEARDLMEVEHQLVESMPAQRKEIYKLVRYEGLTADDIAKQHGIAKRTVECHLYLSRKQVRSFMKNVI